MTLDQMQVERVPNQAELVARAEALLPGLHERARQRKRVDGFLMTLYVNSGRLSFTRFRRPSSAWLMAWQRQCAGL